MSTLLLRLAGPMQAWGTQSKFDIRKTGNEPSKSGIIGMLAAALGRRRDEPVEDLNAMRFGVRVDQPGTVLTDLHTAKSIRTSYLTHRDYLCDAVFLVGLESESEEFLQKLEEALRSPAFPLFLGRRSCPPTGPLVLGIRPCGLIEALTKEPWQASDWYRKKLTQRAWFSTASLRLLVDVEEGEEGVFQRDLPQSFHIEHRQYGYRKVRELPPVSFALGPEQPVEHDPMRELEE